MLSINAFAKDWCFPLMLLQSLIRKRLIKKEIRIEKKEKTTIIHSQEKKTFFTKPELANFHHFPFKV